MIDCISICMILALMIALFNILCKAFPPSIAARYWCAAWVETGYNQNDFPELT